jgi:protein translocase SEC61 complex gamma subunit
LARVVEARSDVPRSTVAGSPWDIMRGASQRADINDESLDTANGTWHYAYKPNWDVGLRFHKLGLRDFFKSSAAIFRLAHKSDRDEFTLYLKLVAIGVAVVGTVGFLIKLLGSIFFG